MVAFALPGLPVFPELRPASLACSTEEDILAEVEAMAAEEDWTFTEPEPSEELQEAPREELQDVPPSLPELRTIPAMGDGLLYHVGPEPLWCERPGMPAFLPAAKLTPWRGIWAAVDALRSADEEEAEVCRARLELALLRWQRSRNEAASPAAP